MQHQLISGREWTHHGGSSVFRSGTVRSPSHEFMFNWFYIFTLFVLTHWELQCILGAGFGSACDRSWTSCCQRRSELSNLLWVHYRQRRRPAAACLSDTVPYKCGVLPQRAHQQPIRARGGGGRGSELMKRGHVFRQWWRWWGYTPRTQDPQYTEYTQYTQ